MKCYFFMLLLGLTIILLTLNIFNIVSKPEQVEQVPIIKPIGTVYKFHKANKEGEPDGFLYVVAYEFEKIEDAVEFKGE